MASSERGLRRARCHGLSRRRFYQRPQEGSTCCKKTLSFAWEPLAYVELEGPSQGVRVLKLRTVMYPIGSDRTGSRIVSVTDKLYE